MRLLEKVAVTVDDQYIYSITDSDNDRSVMVVYG